VQVSRLFRHSIVYSFHSLCPGAPREEVTSHSHIR
jgi:hypothetical protein